MTIRRANEKDIPRIIDLLGQVLEIHAEIRPDIFIPGTTKYTDAELSEMLKDDLKPIYVAVDENDFCVGYAFCQIREQPWFSSSRFLLTICALTKTPAAGTSAKNFLSTSKARRNGLAATR